MIQEITVYIILILTAGFTVYKIYRGFVPLKKNACHPNQCAGCSCECDLKKVV